MALHYLADGYNLLYALPDIPAGSLQDKRAALLRFLLDNQFEGNNKLTVVFDSREGGGNRQVVGRIEVIFTAGESADDWISRKVRELPHKNAVVVVTDDRGIKRMIGGTGARWMGADEFMEL